jgi:hypothetical protein
MARPSRTEPERASPGPGDTQGFDHFLLTRFNLRIAYADRPVGVDPRWLEHRFELFDRFCFPSVRGQSSQRFRWLVLFDAATPEPFRSRIDAYRSCPGFIPVFLDGYSERAVGEHIALLRTPGREYLITSRLDNDDALHRHYVRDVQARFRWQRFEVLCFARGYVWHRNRLYLTHQPSGPFANLIERIGDGPPGAVRTVFWKPHPELASLAGFHSLDTMPLWLQVVHENNVSNRVTGVRCPIGSLAGDFPIDVADLAERENALLLHFDRLACRLSGGTRLAWRRLRGRPAEAQDA